jgi:phosphate transport system substrate-binding protein
VIPGSFTRSSPAGHHVSAHRESRDFDACIITNGVIEEKENSVSRRTVIAAAIAAASLVFGASFAAASSTGGSLKGAGSTFVFPLVSQWQANYKNAQITYGSVGSGAGIAAITARTVDFGASDAPLTKDQASACKGCQQIPWALSSTSIPYHVPGVSYGLKLTGTILANIYLGHITKWNASAIKKINPGVKLPDLKITPVYRSDGSGTSWNFTDYLSRVSPEWKSKVGVGTQPSFPVGIGGKGSSGLAGVVSRTDGAIGYVDEAYSLKNGFKVAKVQNRAGRFQLPGLKGIAAAAATIHRVPSSGVLSIVNPPKSQKLAYPICTFTYVIVPLKSNKSATLKQFISWAITGGQSYAKPLQFYPLPQLVRTADKAFIRKIHS